MANSMSTELVDHLQAAGIRSDHPIVHYLAHIGLTSDIAFAEFKTNTDDLIAWCDKFQAEIKLETKRLDPWKVNLAALRASLVATHKAIIKKSIPTPSAPSATPTMPSMTKCKDSDDKVAKALHPKIRTTHPTPSRSHPTGQSLEHLFLADSYAELTDILSQPSPKKTKRETKPHLTDSADSNVGTTTTPRIVLTVSPNHPIQSPQWNPQPRLTNPPTNGPNNKGQPPKGKRREEGQALPKLAIAATEGGPQRLRHPRCHASNSCSNHLRPTHHSYTSVSLTALGPFDKHSISGSQRDLHL